VFVTGWQNFFVIVSTAAGALTGLMFVVIALRREALATAPRHGLRSFATPTIVHFTTVLGLAALLAMPGLKSTGVGWILVLVGASGLTYTAWIIRSARRFEYQSDLEDTIFHFTLPPLAHGGFVLSGVLAWEHHTNVMYIVAAGLLTLLIVGIHNAWDSAVWFMTH
jgi:hypothetical protein